MSDQQTQTVTVPPPAPIMPANLPPNNVEAEQCVLGCMLIDPTCIPQVTTVLNIESFYREPHQILFNTIVTMNNANIPIDLITLSSTLRDKKLLLGIGGLGYLTSLFTCVPGGTSVVDYYAKLVSETAVKRELMMAGYAIIEMAKDTETDLNALATIAKCKTTIDKVASLVPLPTLITSAQVQYNIYDQAYQRSIEENPFLGYQSPWPELDYKMGRVTNSDYVIIASRPGCGKTSVALQFAEYIASLTNTMTLFYSLEMTEEELQLRMNSRLTRIPLQKLENGDLDDYQWGQFSNASQTLANIPLVYESIDMNDPSSAANMCDIDKLVEKCCLYKERINLGALFIDHIGLMTTSKSRQSQYESTTEVSRKLRLLSLRLRIPVFGLCQLSRRKDERKNPAPHLHELRDSGAIEQDATKVIMLHWPDQYERQYAKIQDATAYIRKNRKGALGEFDMNWDPAYYTFSAKPLDQQTGGNIEDGTSLPYYVEKDREE